MVRRTRTPPAVQRSIESSRWVRESPPKVEAPPEPVPGYTAHVLRVSWPLALLLAVAVALVARRPRLLLPILVVFVIWFVVERVRTNRR
jgi:hypothetical protein